MSTLNAETVFSLIEQLPPAEQHKLEHLMEQRRAEKTAEPARPPRDKRMPDRPWQEGDAAMRWLREHAHEYPGQWVALLGDRLIAHGPNRADVRAAHKAAGLDAGQVLLHRVAASDEAPFMGL
jgi:hypothetical protein